MNKIDINKVQRSTYLATVLKVLLEINNNKHNGDEITYNQKIVEALAIATAFQKHLPISSVETNVDIYFNQQYNMNISTIINEINENHSIDWRAAISFIKKIWRIRYFATYPRLPANTLSSTINQKYFSFYDIILDTPQEMSLEEIKLVNEQCKCKQFSLLVSTYSAYLNKYHDDINGNEFPNYNSMGD